MEQLVGGGDGHAQYLRHHSGVEKQGQVVVGFVDRQFQCLVPPVFQIQRKNSCVSEVSLLNWDTDQAVFSETRQAAELLQQFGGFFCRRCLFGSVWPCTIPVPALRPCLTRTAFASPWYARLLRPQQRHGNTSPGSIISGDGYSVFNAS